MHNVKLEPEKEKHLLARLQICSEGIKVKLSLKDLVNRIKAGHQAYHRLKSTKCQYSYTPKRKQKPLLGPSEMANGTRVLCLPRLLANKQMCRLA